MTINDYTTEAINRFLNYLRDLERAPNTVRAYRSDLLWFVDGLKPGTRLPAITSKQIRSIFLSSRSHHLPYTSKRPSTNTFNRRLSSVRVFFTWLTREEIILKNPALNFDFLPRKRSLPPWLTRGEITNLLYCAKRISPLNYMIFYILYYAALRRSELAALSPNDINFTTNSVVVHGKGNKIRYIPLLKDEIIPIRKYIKSSMPYPPDCKLLLTEQDKPLNTKFIYDRVTRISRNARIPCTPHTLRRSRATHLLNAGMPMAYIRDLLGHASITTTEGYAIVPHDALRRAYNRVAPELLSGRTPSS